MEISRNSIFKLATFTLVFFSLVTFLAMEFLDGKSFYRLFSRETSWYLLVSIGVITGILGGLIGWILVSLPMLNSTLQFFSNLIRPLKLSVWEIVYISFCAGMGEELLFRGLIQPYLGVVITSVVFVALHGYINPKNLPLTCYGVFMTLIICLIGYEARKYGILAAISAHMVIDIILLYKLTHTRVPIEINKETSE